MRRLPSLVPLVVLALTCTAVRSAAAQGASVGADSLKRIAIRQLLNIQRTDSFMLLGMDQAFAAQGNQPDPNLPAGFYDEIRARVRRDIGIFVERLVPVYDSLYTADQITQLTLFYRSAIGQRLLETQQHLMEAIGALGERWGMELAGQVMVDLARRPRP